MTRVREKGEGERQREGRRDGNRRDREVYGKVMREQGERREVYESIATGA